MQDFLTPTTTHTFLYVISFVSLIFVLFAAKCDIKTREIPNTVPLLLIILFLIEYSLRWIATKNYSLLNSIATQLVFAIGILFVLLIVTLLCEKMLEKDLFGGGDIKLVGSTCLFLTFESFVFVMLTSCITFIVFSLFKRNKNTGFSNISLPFAPFWAFGYTCVIVITICRDFQLF